MTKGIDIARQLISEEETAKTGFLDLGNLGLTCLPDELLKLEHLRTLNLGGSYRLSEYSSRYVTGIEVPNGLGDDLSRLNGLPHLSTLLMNSAYLESLIPLQSLTRLLKLECYDTQVSDLMPLQGLTRLQGLDCGATQVRDLTPLQAVPSLKSLRCHWTQVNDLTPLQGLTRLQSLDCARTQVSDLTPLQVLPNLKRIRCRGAQVSDLTPLQSIPNLQSLECDDTQVSDLTPLQGMANLENFDCGATEVSDLTPLQGIKCLKSLNCYDAKVSDLTPLQGLTRLETLVCAGTQVSDLTPLQSLAKLQQLNCAGTNVNDLTPLQCLNNLWIVDCSGTHVSNLTPLQHINSLQIVRCSGTEVSDLTPVSSLPNLKELAIDRCVVACWHNDLWSSDSLKTVEANEAELAGIPTDVLSAVRGENCLPTLRAHLEDLGDRPESLTDVKLVVLGNGRIGKTQIVNRLRGEPFEEEADSTHGVSIVQSPIPGAQNEIFNIWDFGGQDIYFGTHMLFLKSRAVFMLVWTPESDDAETHDHGGMNFKNQPVAWWLDCIRRFGNERAPLIVVQNQLDRIGYCGEHSALVDSPDQWEWYRTVAYSAKTDEGRGALNDHLEHAAKRFNPPLVGKGRLAVMRQLQVWREVDRKRTPEDKRHRTLTFEAFKSLCEKTGGVSDPVQFLHSLHNAGQIFWRKDLFQNRVILDQAWVLDAVYAIFHRENCLGFLKRHHGRITRSDLAMLVWEHEGFSLEEQELFLSFMQSCGICFRLREGSKDAETVYIAPDHLPKDWDPTTRALWGHAAPDSEQTFTYESLPPALMRNLIGRIGREAGLSCDYWRNGFYGYESRTDARVLVEQAMNDQWQGEIRIQARGFRAPDLVAEIEKALLDEERKLGLSADRQEPEARPPKHQDDPAEAQPLRLEFVPEPRDKRSYYVSYAWEDDRSEAGKTRARIVDQFCERAAEEHGVFVQRDKDVMRIGDRISTFMKRIARGDRVIVVLSDKYLRSPFCMYELYEIWLQARAENDRFLKRICVFTQRDAKIWTIEDRLESAKYWNDEYTKYASIDGEQLLLLGEKDLQRVKLMRHFASHVGEILTHLTDILQPQTLDELERYAFDSGEFDD